MRVVLLEEAASDLENIFTWIAQDDPTVAHTVVRRIFARIARLETSGLEHIGRLGVISGTRELVDSPFIIVYEIHEDIEEILILAIFHMRQDRS